MLMHGILIRQYGGHSGIRDEGALEAALYRPQSGYYPDLISQAAALFESLVINHPFVDGNKRTGYLAMLAILENEHTFLNASNDELYNLVIEMSTGQIRFDQIVIWLKENCSPA